ncbi:universal stress protein [Streptomyces sp. CC208A]|uniref:universal stress protein n=1 Tax=Streptomyces sp. CC208A TaxID=3044573 RepID=UPI0024A96A39|nr:universal stress protein [Streptomyces sp. CC208A]
MARIVTVGIDGSAESLAAADWAAEEALRRAVPLRLLRAWDTDDDPRTRVVDPATAREWGERALDAARRRLSNRHPGLRIETAGVTEDPVEALCAAAGEADVLVLGSRGLGVLSGFLAGSVSLAVLARVQRPVVLVRPQGRPAPGEDRPAGDVVVGLDVSEAGDEVLAYAFAAADRYGCGLRVLHSWSVPVFYGAEPSGYLPMIMTQTDREARLALDAALEPWAEKYPDVPLVRECRQGRPAKDLVEAARDARLLVVGRRIRRARIGTHIGAVTHAVVHHATTPVAVVPHD